MQNIFHLHKSCNPKKFSFWQKIIKCNNVKYTKILRILKRGQCTPSPSHPRTGVSCRQWGCVASGVPVGVGPQSMMRCVGAAPAAATPPHWSSSVYEVDSRKAFNVSYSWKNTSEVFMQLLNRVHVNKLAYSNLDIYNENISDYKWDWSWSTIYTYWYENWKLIYILK